MIKRNLRVVLEDAYIGAITGCFFGLLYSSWVVVLMLVQWSVSIRMRHGASLHGGAAILAFCTVGVLAGGTMSAMRSVMRYRLAAFLLGALWCGVLLVSLARAVTGIEISFLGAAVVNSTIALGLGGYAGLKVRKGLMQK